MNKLNYATQNNTVTQTYQYSVHTFNPLKLPGLVGEELEDFVDLGVESWLLGVPLTDHETTEDKEFIKTQSNQMVYKHQAHAQCSSNEALINLKLKANGKSAKSKNNVPCCITDKVSDK